MTWTMRSRDYSFAEDGGYDLTGPILSLGSIAEFIKSRLTLPLYFTSSVGNVP